MYWQGFDKVVASYVSSGESEGEIEAELRKLVNRSLLQETVAFHQQHLEISREIG